MRLFILLFLISAIVTGLVRRHLVKRGVMDLPNIRSSHSVAVPRGGGLGIVLVFLCAVAWCSQRQVVPVRIAWALLGGGILISIVGFLDDHFKLPPWPRLIIHSLAAAWALVCLNAVRTSPFDNSSVWREWMSRSAMFVGLVWLTNLFNFMDGIDGLAATEAVSVSGLGAFLLWRNGLPDYAQVSWMLAAGSLGFLVWNWPPARVFMGDAGSCFLGFSLGVLGLFSSKANMSVIWLWLILLAVFVADSTVTLLRRVLSRTRWYEAHRNHAYQHAAQTCGSHAKVTLAVAGINIAWLFPLAWGTCRYPAAAPAFATAAFVPLLYLAFRFDAGEEAGSS
jgi:Fuc2NAc and GlcNAc transferase